MVALLSRTVDGVTEYLLVKSKKDFGEFTGCWYPPGGHIEEGEEEATALIREISEELNLEIKPIKKIATTPGDVENQITHWWEGEILSGELTINQEEIAEAGWFSKDDLTSIKLWPATQMFLEKFIFPHEA